MAEWQPCLRVTSFWQPSLIPPLPVHVDESVGLPSPLWSPHQSACDSPNQVEVPCQREQLLVFISNSYQICPYLHGKNWMMLVKQLASSFACCEHSIYSHGTFRLLQLILEHGFELYIICQLIEAFFSTK